MGVSINGGSPKWLVNNGKSDDLGVPHISGNLQIIPQKIGYVDILSFDLWPYCSVSHAHGSIIAQTMHLLATYQICI